MLQLVTPLLKDDDLEYFSKRLRTSINKWSSLDLHTALPVLLAMLERLHSVEKYRAKCLSHMVEAANAFVIAILNITPQNLRVQECLITVCHFVHTVTKLGGGACVCLCLSVAAELTNTGRVCITASAVNRVLAVPMHQLLQVRGGGSRKKN